MKAHRTISLDADISMEIQQRTSTYGFDFSKWISDRYLEEFHSEKYLITRIEELEKELSTLQKDLSIERSILPSNVFESLSLDEQSDIKSLTINSPMLYKIYLKLKLKWAWEMSFRVFSLLVRDYGHKG